jgi:FkbM family methyltransferase
MGYEHLPTYGFNWKAFAGSAVALGYARRDLAVVERVLKLVPGRTACVQAGGSLGIYPKFLARSFDCCYCFEPSADLFPAMCQNAPEPNIIRIQAALGFNRQLVSTSQTRRGTKAHKFPHEGITHINGTGLIPTLQIDDLRLPVCDLIMIDLEGYELHALRGTVDTLSRCRPVLCVEINDNIEHYGAMPEDVRQFLHVCGYRLVFREHSDEVYVPEERP